MIDLPGFGGALRVLTQPIFRSIRDFIEGHGQVP